MNLHCIDVLSKDFPHCRDMIDYFPDFVVLNVHELLAAFSVLHFCKSYVYVNYKFFNIYRKFFLSLSSTQMC